MNLFIKENIKTAIVFAILFFSQQGAALSLDLKQLTEAQLLRIIDEEFLRMSPDPENLEWTEEAGIQPTDTYELDYSEKCEFIRSTPNKKALTACYLILEADEE
ncbi:MAG: hypothetical protein AAGB31_13015 [Bdellovibrio sp.]